MEEASSVLNAHLLAREDVHFKPCESFNLTELDIVQEALASFREPTLLDIYAPKQDPRRERMDAQTREQQWKRMHEVAQEEPQFAGILRDGRCREVVMWFIHHLSGESQTQFGATGLTLPLLPVAHHSQEPPVEDNIGHWVYEQYQQAVTCQQCHL